MHHTIKSLIVVSWCILLLNGCSLFQTVPDPVIIEERVEQLAILHPPLPPKMQLYVPLFLVVTPERMQQFLTAMSTGEEKERAFIGMEIEEYENLAKTMKELQRYIIDQKNLIKYYRSINNSPTTLETVD